MDGQADGWMDGGWMDGQMDGWMDEWLDGWLDGGWASGCVGSWMDGQTGTQVTDRDEVIKVVNVNNVESVRPSIGCVTRAQPRFCDIPTLGA